MISIPGSIPITIYPIFWVLIVLIGWLNSASLVGTAIWSLVILFSILIHEYGHALTASFFGQKAEIQLVGLGGVTKREGPQIKRWKEFLIILNGPLAGLLTFAALYFFVDHLEERQTLLFYACQVAIEVNLFWTLLNLLPVIPLDGGQLLRVVLEGLFGLRGLKFAYFISIALAVVLGVMFFLMQQIFMGAIFFMFAFEAYRAWADLKSFVPQDGDEEIQDLMRRGVEDLQEGHPHEALAKFISVRDQTLKGVLFVNATEYGARILAEQGEIKQAYEWLYPLKNRISIDYLNLLQQLAYHLQEWEETVVVGEQAFQQQGTMHIALLNALSCAMMERSVQAVGWLTAASQLGLPDFKNVIARHEFDAIRESAPFQKWVKGLE